MALFARVFWLKECLAFEVAGNFAYDAEMNLDNFHLITSRVKGGTVIPGTS
jgi:hypothetical protein